MKKIIKYLLRKEKYTLKMYNDIKCGSEVTIKLYCEVADCSITYSKGKLKNSREKLLVRKTFNKRLAKCIQ